MEQAKIQQLTLIGNLLEVGRVLSSAREKSTANKWRSVSVSYTEVEALELVLVKTATQLSDLFQMYEYSTTMADKRAKMSESVTSSFLAVRHTMHKVWRDEATIPEFREALRKFVAA